MSEVRVEHDEGRVTLVLENEARRNAMDVALLTSLEARAREIAADESVRVVVLRGAGTRAFCSGADLDAMCVRPVSASVEQMENLLKQALLALTAIDVPVVAAIQGACIGGGVQLALCADIRFASETAAFAIPAAQAGLPYPFDALKKIVALMGEGQAKAFLLGMQKLDAQRALFSGLIEMVAPEDEFETGLAALVNAIAGLPRDSAVSYKRILSAIALGNMESASHAHTSLHAKGLYLHALDEMASRKARKPAEPA